MKHFSIKQLFFILFFCQATTVFSQIKRKVLFLGNSYTSVNNLPQTIANVALSVGDTLIYDSNTPGGHTLLQHSSNPISQSKIMAGGWHHVVLQGQSQEPITNESNFYAGMTNLNALIKQYNPCSVPISSMTWGRKNGDALNCPLIPVMCTYEGMDTTIKRDYLIAAEFLRNEISPVSVVWKYLRNNHPTINLYHADESHPSAEGSYAAACCFYASIFKKDPALITFNYGLSPTDAAIIRNAAKINVFDSLNLWNYKKLPVSEFSFIIGAGVNEVIFTNTSQHADNYLWNFGDATTSTLKTPTHSYLSNGTYSVTLTASNCDLQGLHTSVTDTIISFCAHTPIISPDTLLLCPSGSDTLWTQLGSSYQWYNNGIPILGATNQYLVASRSVQLIDFPYPSVLTTNAGCSELSKQAFVGAAGWMGFNIIAFNTIGNVLSGDRVCVGETLKLVTYFFENHVTQWYKNGVPIPFASGDTLVVNNSGTYKCKVIHPMCSNISGYSDSINYKFISCAVGLNENNPSIFESIYPNPSNGVYTIKTDGEIEDWFIYNSFGKIIAHGKTKGINISDHLSGLYYIKIILEDKTYTILKIVKQ